MLTRRVDYSLPFSRNRRIQLPQTLHWDMRRWSWTFLDPLYVRGLDPMHEIFQKFYWAADTNLRLVSIFLFWNMWVAWYFSQKDTGNQYFYFPGPLDEQYKTKNMAVASRFSVWPKKDETEQILRNKYAQLTRCKFLCPHRSWWSEAKRRNREITGFDHRNVIDRSSEVSWTTDSSETV